MGKLSCDGLPALLLSLSFLFGPISASELSFVTCGSVVKLLNIQHNVRLHSHDVRYGSGEYLIGYTHSSSGRSGSISVSMCLLLTQAAGSSRWPGWAPSKTVTATGVSGGAATPCATAVPRLCAARPSASHTSTQAGTCTATTSPPRSPRTRCVLMTETY